MLDAGTVGLVGAVFVASAVECVEASTIVLAMGMTRGWKSTFVGSLLAVVALGVIVAAAGVGLRNDVSRSLLQLTIGTLLLVFGLQWLRKAILRESGLKAKHDEDSIYRREEEAARKAGDVAQGGLDWFAFVVSFKGVFLEGLEVVFIVITFGLTVSHGIPVAVIGASAAFIIVFLAALIAHRPLSAVPENWLKFAVAELLCTFGTFWACEGLGYFTPAKDSIEWPAGDVALLAVLACWIVVSFICVKALRRLSAAKLGARPAEGGAE
jgi:uncharacterized membrane protein